MARKPQPLTLESPTTVEDEQLSYDGPKSPMSLKSPKSPRSPFRFTSTRREQDQSDDLSMQPPAQQYQLPHSQTLPALHHPSASVGGQENQKPERSRGFFGNYNKKASKSTNRLQHTDNDLVTEDNMSKDTDRPALSGKVSSQDGGKNDASAADRAVTRRPVGGPSNTNVSIASTDSAPSSSSSTIKKSKPKPFSLLGRTKSIRGDEESSRDPSPNNKHLDTARSQPQDHPSKTAPLRADGDRTFRDMMGSNTRQHSADRVPTRARDVPSVREPKDNNKSQTSFSNSFREGNGHSFLNNLKAAGSKGAGAISKGLFGGKGERSNSTTQKVMPVDDEHYELKVINQPLYEQTRITRISKRLEDSRDKTEFWMPAFPWRAIDYLNYKGSDVEGLYRVPGSGPQIKKWQRRFDEELDIDLFEQDDLYDINIIGSMLKAWLRELPDELFPKASQDRVARECAANPSETVPQVLIDELSALSPFNYYLLFAITCHLSLLLAHSDKNKMDYRNLCICFQPCMKIDAFCFKYLVCDWRDCWKGCKTEGDFTEREYAMFIEQENMESGKAPNSADGRSVASTAVESHDDRNVSSSDSSKPSTASMNDQAKWGQQKQVQGQQDKKLPLSQSQSQSSSNTVNTTLTMNQDRTPPRKNQQMRPLSPIAPLSPIGL